MSSGARGWSRTVKAACERKYPRFIPNPDSTHCYCHALDLTYPHYLAEHTQDHEDARELRALLAEGTDEE